MKKKLLDASFVQLNEQESWDLKKKGSYFVIRNDSSIVAFRLGSKSVIETGFRMVGAHTDSPCFKVKPNPEIESKGYNQLGVEVYGGVLLNRGLIVIFHWQGVSPSETRKVNWKTD